MASPVCILPFGLARTSELYHRADMYHVVLIHVTFIDPRALEISFILVV